MSGATTPDDRTPVIIGAGQFLNRSGPPQEPAMLMVEAVRAAVEDTTVTVPASRVGVIAAVPTLSWRYNDPGRIVAEQIGASNARTWYATVGGNTPQAMVNRLANAIAAGEVDLGIVCGGEAANSRRAARREGHKPDWTSQDESVRPDWHDGGDFFLGHPAESEAGVVMPVQVYPLFESALWHHSGRTREDHIAYLGRLWAGFSQVASRNPYAWDRTAHTAEEIVTPGPTNRYVGSPYTKKMVSNPNVDMSSAVIMCSVAAARELGVPTDRWVFQHSGTDGNDLRLSERVDFVSSPAIRVAGNRALELAGVDIDDVAHLDVYSCFPSAVQIANSELGIDDTRQLTVYGGLPFAGGPWNNPVGHAIASMVDTLRNDPGARGLVTANGGHVDKHAFGVYSTSPPAQGFRHDRPQAEIDRSTPTPAEIRYSGPARIEAWTVMHGRDGSAESAHAACRTDDGVRVWGLSNDPELMARMVSDDMTDVAVLIGTDHAMTPV